MTDIPQLAIDIGRAIVQLTDEQLDDLGARLRAQYREVYQNADALEEGGDQAACTRETELARICEALFRGVDRVADKRAEDGWKRRLRERALAQAAASR